MVVCPVVAVGAQAAGVEAAGALLDSFGKGFGTWIGIVCGLLFALLLALYAWLEHLAAVRRKRITLAGARLEKARDGDSSELPRVLEPLVGRRIGAITERVVPWEDGQRAQAK